VSAGWPVVSVEEMRSLEAAAFASAISEDELQANAAHQIALVAAQVAPSAGRVAVLVGPGNNGRDAFLAGRLLAQRGRRVHFYLGPRNAIRPEELARLRAPLERARLHSSDSDLAALAAELGRAAIAIDGLLGIGVHGPMRSPLDRLASTLNEAAGKSGARVVSVDVPSGIDADTGEVPGEAVRADLTIALGAVKAGCLRFPAANYVGRLEPRPIGLPEVAEAGCRIRLLTADLVASLVPERPLDAHKGTLGWVLIIGGSREYVGAPILSGSAAGRSGCGLVALAVPPNVQSPAAAALPEATYLLRDDRPARGGEAERLIGRLADFRAVVLGPGLGREDASVGLVRGLLARLGTGSNGPAVIVDADALWVLSGWPYWWNELSAGCLLTPHHGEMARLTGLSTAEIARRSWEIALEQAARWRQIVVLKGAHTVVAEPGGRAWVHPRANPGLATAGTGDVLAGLIGGLAAQGLDPLQAAQLAVVVHSLAAERVLGARPWRSLLASDLLPALPAVLAELVAGYSGEPTGPLLPESTAGFF
jgi:NAD(P)H-hydrate epimerase